MGGVPIVVGGCALEFRGEEKGLVRAEGKDGEGGEGDEGEGERDPLVDHQFDGAAVVF